MTGRIGLDSYIGQAKINLATLLATTGQDDCMPFSDQIYMFILSLNAPPVTVAALEIKPIEQLSGDSTLGLITAALSPTTPELELLAYETLVGHLKELGGSFLTRFDHTGRISDLEEAIRNLRQVVDLTACDNTNLVRPSLLSNYGGALGRRYAHLGNIADLDDSIKNLREAVLLAEDGQEGKAGYHSNLGSSLAKRFSRTGNLEDLDEAIYNLQNASRLTDDSYAHKPLILSNLGSSKGDRYTRLGNLDDLEDSIKNKEKAVRLTDDGNPNKPHLLANLGHSHLKRFNHLGELQDLEAAIETRRQAITLMHTSHPDIRTYISQLGGSQLTRFERLGHITDLEDSIANLQVAVNLTDDAHPEKPGFLTDLGSSQQARYIRLGEVADLESALMNLRHAVLLLDDGDPKKPGFVANLAVSQLSRYERRRDLKDLEDAISNFQIAVWLTDSQAPWYSNLACAQQARFYLLDELPDLEDSIENLRMAIRLTADEHPKMSGYLSNLSESLKTRYNRLGNLNDIEEAVKNLQIAVLLVDDEHPDKVRTLRRLGVALRVRFRDLGDPDDVVAAVEALRGAAQTKTGYPMFALEAAIEWIEVSQSVGDLQSALEGYRTALEIIPKLAWLGLSAASRQVWLKRVDSESLSTKSATCAIRLGRLKEAVELLDLGRSVMWQQASSLRADLESLRVEDPALAKEFESVGRELDAGNFTTDISILSIQGVNKDPNAEISNAEITGAERHRLVDTWEGLLERVRKLPNFEHFLKPVPFNQLRKAAKEGHVVIINVSTYGVDALIFDSDDTHPIQHVSFPDIDIDTLLQLSSDIVLKRPSNPTAERHRRYIKNFLKPALKLVWEDMISPIFENIGIPVTAPANLPDCRIWWYPTGPLTFFPIHAAGPGGAIDVSRMAISSYISTLGALFRAQQKSEQKMPGIPNLLAVSQTNTPGEGPLPLCIEEVETLTKIALSADWPANNITNLNDSDATVIRVSEALDTSSHIHFACHGIQQPILGTESAFALHDGRLSLSSIASKQLSSGQFAFLSVCHAAAGSHDLPGENMHLAAGLQFSGFPSVIGTMWGIVDQDAPIVAGNVYEYLFRNGVGKLEPGEAAMALNRAVLKLREDKSVTVDRWAPFIHLGI